MSPSATVRLQARNALKGNYAAAVAAFVILLFPIYIIYGLSAAVEAVLAQVVADKVTYALMIVAVETPVNVTVMTLLSPLWNGYIALFYRAAKTNTFDPRLIFRYFSAQHYQKTLSLNLSFAVRMMLPFIVFYLPVAIYDVFTLNYVSNFYGTTLHTDFRFILTVLSTILIVLYSLKYFVVFALYTEQENADNKSLFRQSKAIMEVHGRSASRLIFSFTPWMLLCLTVLPLLYVVPYMTQAMCIGAKWMIRTEQERKPS